MLAARQVEPVARERVLAVRDDRRVPVIASAMPVAETVVTPAAPICVGEPVAVTS